MSRALDRALLQHEEMPNVGGDPIVESGSNSDGEWTRWADGTQVCRYLSTVEYTPSNNNGSIYFTPSETFTYPQIFLRNPTVSGAGKRGSNTPQVSWVAPRSVSETFITVFGCGAYDTTDSILLGYVAMGYWK